MEFRYVSDYALHLCLDYMKHDNIYDRFTYTWEEDEDCYYITFIEYKNSLLSLKNAPKPLFRVTFEDLGERTGITVESLSGIMFARTKDIDLFWEKKLGAKRLKRQ